MAIMRRRAVLMAAGVLSAIYRKVEYLESTGTQYIRLPISGEASFSVEAQALDNSSGNKIVVGYGSNAGQYFSITNTGSAILWSLGGGIVINDISALDWTNINVAFELINNNSSAILDINGRIITRTAEIYTGQIPQYIIFGWGTYLARVRIKTCIAVKNNVTVLNLVPCVRKSDSKPGMYDTVSKGFYTNSGADEFVVPS